MSIRVGSCIGLAPAQLTALLPAMRCYQLADQLCSCSCIAWACLSGHGHDMTSPLRARAGHEGGVCGGVVHERRCGLEGQRMWAPMAC